MKAEDFTGKQSAVERAVICLARLYLIHARLFIDIVCKGYGSWLLIRCTKYASTLYDV